MSKETKFGYGFLLAGVGMPYLIEKFVGQTWAVLVALLCVLLSIFFLIAGHLHERQGLAVKIISVVVAVALISGGIAWRLRSKTQEKEVSLQPSATTNKPLVSTLESMPFVIGAPLGENYSPKWLMMIHHYGSEPAYNCDIGFSDLDRKNIEHEWLVKHPNSSFPPHNLAGESQKSFHIAESDPLGIPAKFEWSPLDPNHQHYDVEIVCRNGQFSEDWEVVRVRGFLRTKIKIERFFQSEQRSEPVYSCADPSLESGESEVDPKKRFPKINPGWTPNRIAIFPVAIVDPNQNVEVLTVGKPGCWKCLQEHCGGV
jgi:hypothetical protein